jgi:opacity protein-like surface antigen
MLAVLAGGMLTSDALAQSGAIEIGFDTGLTLRLNSDKNGFEYENQTAINIPLQSVRVGFFVSDQLSIEPAIGFSYLDVGDTSITQLGAGANLQYHFTADATRTRFYIGAGGGLNLLDIGDEQETQFGLGAGLGVKLPIASRMAIRIEGSFSRFFESDLLPGANVIGALVGFSFFTK